jgi:hypothetical protein
MEIKRGEHGTPSIISKMSEILFKNIISKYKKIILKSCLESAVELLDVAKTGFVELVALTHSVMSRYNKSEGGNYKINFSEGAGLGVWGQIRAEINTET